MNVVMENLDIDRLHEAVTAINAKQLLPRQSGITTAYLTLMVAEVALGDYNNTYLYVGPTCKCASEMMLSFYDTIREHYGSVVIERVSTASGQIRTVFGQRFFFISQDRLSLCAIKGLTIHRVFYDVARVDRTAYRAIQPCLDIACGDII